MALHGYTTSNFSVHPIKNAKNQLKSTHKIVWFKGKKLYYLDKHVKISIRKIQKRHSLVHFYRFFEAIGHQRP